MWEFRERLGRRQEGAGVPGKVPAPTIAALFDLLTQEPPGHHHRPPPSISKTPRALMAPATTPPSLQKTRYEAPRHHPSPTVERQRAAGRGQRDEGGVVGRATRAPSPPATTPTASALPKMTTPAPPSAAKSPPRRATSPPPPAPLSRRERVVRYPVPREYPPPLPRIPSGARGRPQHPRTLPYEWEGERKATSTHHHNTQYTHRHRPH